MANQNTNQPSQSQKTQQNWIPVDPFTHLMWGPPPGAPSFMPNQPTNTSPSQPNQGQGAAMPGFLDVNGNFDFNKLLDGADKMFKLINQTQPLLKQLGPFFNIFR